MLSSEEVFQDYTIATSLERYVTTAKAVLTKIFDKQQANASFAHPLAPPL